jgi:RNA polymerase sigma-70 factor (ECF subfamily)
MATTEKARPEVLRDEEVVDLVKGGEIALYEVIMRRYNQRLFRVARAILRDDAEAEDVMQDAYVRAYQHLHQFERRAPFSVWLTRIAVHEALARLRSRNRLYQLDAAGNEGGTSMNLADPALNPELAISQAELRPLLERAVIDLPEQYRTVVMLRDVEELSTSETASVLSLSEQNVKVRLHRGHAMLRKWFLRHVGAKAREAFPFMGARCDRVVNAVLQRIATVDSPADLLPTEHPKAN